MGTKTDLPWILGGHDCAAVLGQSPYKTPLQVWAEKVGEVTPEDISDKSYIIRGHEMEPHLLDIYGAVTHREVIPIEPREAEYTVRGKSPQIQRIHHPDYPQFVSAPDGLVMRVRNGQDQLGTLDAKSVGMWVREKWGEPLEGDGLSLVREDGERREVPRPIPTATEVPVAEMIQHQFYMWVEDKPFSSYAVGIVDDRAYRTPIQTENGAALFGLIDFLWCDVERNDAFIDAMKNRLLEMDECIRTATRPPWEVNHKDKDVLLELLGRESVGQEIDLTIEHLQLVQEAHRLKAEEKACDERYKTIQALLMDALGSAEYGVLPNGNRVSFKTRKEHERPAVTVKESRILRMPQARHMKAMPESSDMVIS